MFSFVNNWLKREISVELSKGNDEQARIKVLLNACYSFVINGRSNL